MSWPEVKKINSNLDKPLDTLIDETVGDNADAASSTGTVHAKIKELRNYIVNTVYAAISSGVYGKLFAASTTVIASYTGPAQYLGSTYAKGKSFLVLERGTFRVSFGLYVEASTGYTAYATIYKNGVAYGTEHSTASNTEVTFTEDLFFNPGDTIELWVKCGNNGAYVYLKNVKVMGTATTPMAATLLS